MVDMTSLSRASLATLRNADQDLDRDISSATLVTLQPLSAHQHQTAASQMCHDSADEIYLDVIGDDDSVTVPNNNVMNTLDSTDHTRPDSNNFKALAAACSKYCLQTVNRSGDLASEYLTPIHRYDNYSCKLISSASASANNIYDNKTFSLISSHPLLGG